GPGRGFRPRDRRHHPLHPAPAARLVGRADPAPSRVRHHRAPRPDNETGLSAGALGRGRGRAARARAPPPRTTPRPLPRAPRPHHRRGSRRPRPDHPGVLRATRSPPALPTHEGGGMTPCWTSWWTRIAVVMIPKLAPNQLVSARRDRPI